MQNRTFLGPIFCEKLETAPPLKKIGCRSCEVDVVIRNEKAFEFPILAEKSVTISVKTFFFFFFFFGDHLFLGRKTFEFPILAKKSVSISVKTFFLWRPLVFGRKKRLNFRVIPSQVSDKPSESDS